MERLHRAMNADADGVGRNRDSDPMSGSIGARHWVRIYFCLPHLHLHSTPPLENPRRNIDMTFGKEKLEWRDYQKVKKIEDMFIRFDRMYERDRQTDGHRMTA